jgi:hypothetical protein
MKWPIGGAEILACRAVSAVKSTRAAVAIDDPARIAIAIRPIVGTIVPPSAPGSNVTVSRDRFFSRGDRRKAAPSRRRTSRHWRLSGRYRTPPPGTARLEQLDRVSDLLERLVYTRRNLSQRTRSDSFPARRRVRQ